MGLDQETDRLLQVLAQYDPVNKTVLHQKFRCLESLRKLLADRLLDDSWSRKTDQCPRLSHDHVAKHRKACRDTAGRGVCQDRAVQQPGITVPLDRSRSLCHLHQRDDPLLHSGTTGTAEQKHRKPQLRRALDRPGDLLAHNMAHTRHHKAGIAHTQDDVIAKYLASSDSHRLIQSGLFPRCRKFVLVPLIVQRVAYFHILEPWLKALRVSDHADTIVGLHPEITAALIALILFLHDARTVYHPAALRTLDKTCVLFVLSVCLLRSPLRVL